MILYSTNCPRCRVLEMKLNQKNIEFEINTDVDKIIELGFQTAPVLEYNGQYYNFNEAIDLIKEL